MSNADLKKALTILYRKKDRISFQIEALQKAQFILDEQAAKEMKQIEGGES